MITGAMRWMNTSVRLTERPSHPCGMGGTSELAAKSPAYGVRPQLKQAGLPNGTRRPGRTPDVLRLVPRSFAAFRAFNFLRLRHSGRPFRHREQTRVVDLSARALYHGIEFDGVCHLKL